MVPSKLFLKDLKEQFSRVSNVFFVLFCFFPELLMIIAYSTKKENTIFVTSSFSCPKCSH